MDILEKMWCVGLQYMDEAEDLLAYCTHSLCLLGEKVSEMKQSTSVPSRIYIQACNTTTIAGHFRAGLSTHGNTLSVWMKKQVSFLENYDHVQAAWLELGEYVLERDLQYFLETNGIASPTMLAFTRKHLQQILPILTLAQSYHIPRYRIQKLCDTLQSMFNSKKEVSSITVVLDNTVPEQLGALLLRVENPMLWQLSCATTRDDKRTFRVIVDDSEPLERRAIDSWKDTMPDVAAWAIDTLKKTVSSDVQYTVSFALERKISCKP